ncbi:unnamed protein product [Moneuplotes crassus]|uniref:Uncharacterized protein n=1 Tax=Euplotes crassus TaxID=5936 RepID=A0AAD1Y4D9_EUPCR|nr:unnamed protein product [Moneuplotes crassus]
MEKGAEILQGRKKDISIVAEDQNWRSYIDNELKCAEIWQKDWGFLADKGDGARPDKELTKEDKIRQLEEELADMNRKKGKLETTNLTYGGGGDDLEKFRLTHIHKRKNVELQPVPRRPKKG